MKMKYKDNVLNPMFLIDIGLFFVIKNPPHKNIDDKFEYMNKII